MTNEGFLQIVYAPKNSRLFSYDQKNILKCNTGIIALAAAITNALQLTIIDDVPISMPITTYQELNGES